ncbi:MAG: DUF6391 domain-containing protein [Anaerolineales bacterium]
MPNALSKLMNQPLLLRIRRNHGLEHATIHMLSAKYPRIPIAGRADANGFLILGRLPTDAIAESADEAAARLRAGEEHLAIHPNCGTNFLTAAVLAGLACFATLLGGRTDRARDRLERLPLAILATVLALIIAQPIGSAAQRHVTTSSEIGGLRIGEVQQLRRGRTTVHRVRTQG